MITDDILKQRPLTPAQWGKKIAWRHAVGIAAVIFALFPLIWMISASFDTIGSLSAQKLIPDHPGLENFRTLLTNPDQPYLKWLRNSVVISASNAVLQMFIGATAAYALSRFRFKGRKLTLMTILVVQMFPQLLAATAIFLMLADLGKSIPFLALGQTSALIIVFAGGALGINAWMLKGFYDTIPAEIDESAKVDGASHAQIYFRIILPLARPVLAVITLLSFIGTMNEFLITSVILGGNQNSITLAVGMQQYIDGQYNAHWG
ncbi:MAG: ABC transporter permease subunit, partial [Acidobacteriota bacterium]|nr:ABC transporter permease subunit [Acidobacteriota bacterium]